MTIKQTSDAVAVTGAEEAEREARRRRRFHESLHPARPMAEDVAGLVDDFTSALRLGVEDDVTIPFDLAVRIHAALTTPTPAVSMDEAIEQIVVGFSDKAILRLDIDEDDPRLSLICDEMRCDTRAILSRIRGEDGDASDAALLADICDNMAEVLKPLPGEE